MRDATTGWKRCARCAGPCRAEQAGMVLADDLASLLKRWALCEEQQRPLLALLEM